MSKSFKDLQEMRNLRSLERRVGIGHVNGPSDVECYFDLVVELIK